MEIIKIVIVIVLVVVSGLFSGLLLGLMSLSLDMLRRKVALNNPAAVRIYPLRKKSNQLLCTLILGNVAVNTTIALVLGSLTSGFIAGVIATSLIVVFGEILPQAFFAKHGLVYGAKAAGLVELLMVLFYPITKPIALLLDKLVGGNLPTIYSRKEFHLLLRQQRTRAEKLGKSDIAHHEFDLLERGLVLSEKRVKDIMTPFNTASVINRNAVLDKKVIGMFRERGYSRVPVFDPVRRTIVGLLYAKDLFHISPGDKVKVTVETMMRKTVQYISPDDRLDRVLELFKKKHTHLFIVRNHRGKITGILSLEDVLEEIVGEIIDEYD
ncbi:MAG: CNNM domain-containing protein [Candidatus Woesearchaeota archaeon]|nr:CNNM domain-containing protein [Candidatus Woesearchaeota archaeon]